MKLLFVDDEPEILAGLRRLLYDLDESWKAEFVNSGLAALAVLERGPVDVVVSDMRMPGMDGVSFLEQVQLKYPNTIRMVLSGQTDERSAIRALRVAHQFLSKPFEANLFCALIEQTANLTRLMQDDSMRQLIGNLSRLPPVPKLYQELSVALQREETKTEDVVKLIKRDPTMTAKLLQMANSAFFARRVPTADLRAAVVHLGMNTIRHLVLTVELFDSSGPVGKRYDKDLEDIRTKAMKMATVAEALAQGTELRSEAFTMGLLADIGQVVFAITKADEWNQCCETALVTNRPLHEVEYETFGVSHAEVGGFLLGIWGLPFSVVEAVVHHHLPERIVAPVMGPAAITALANSVVYGSELNPAWVERLGATAKLKELRERFGKAGAS